MYKDSYKFRKKYYVTLFVSIYVFIFLVLALIVWANWKYIKTVFQGSQPQPLAEEQVQFNELFEKVGYLEELSREYNEKDYQKRTVAYILSNAMCTKLPIWEADFSTDDLADFKNYVTTHDKKNVASLTSLGESIPLYGYYGYTFIVPQTKQEVDFYQLFAVINTILVYQDNNFTATSSDMYGWGRNICQFATDCYEDNKYSSLSGDALYNDIKNNMDEYYPEAYRNADIDAVNICTYMKKSDFCDSIYTSALMYYSSLTTTRQKNMFKDYLSIKKQSASVASENLFERLTSTIQNMLKYESLEIYYDSKDETCVQIYKYCLQAFVESLS